MRSAPPHSDPQNSTTLKWCDDGELSPLDLQRVLTRLCRSEPELEQWIQPSGIASTGCGSPLAGEDSSAVDATESVLNDAKG